MWIWLIKIDTIKDNLGNFKLPLNVVTENFELSFFLDKLFANVIGLNSTEG